MSFRFKSAVRQNVHVLVGVAGPSNSGKTLSALKIARGLAGGRVSDPVRQAEIDAGIFVIDTEAGRALHYAPAPGEQPTDFLFSFTHGELNAPFTPAAYIEALEAAQAAGAKVIVFDSFSHEWEGDGGCLDMQAAELEESVERARRRHQPSWGEFDEDRTRQANNIGAWKNPKAEHKRLMRRCLQAQAHLIFCLRAGEKLEMRKEGRKTVIVAAETKAPRERWTPICEKGFMYELTLSCVVAPDRPGKPYVLKTNEHFARVIDENKLIDESIGVRLANWSNAGAAQAAETADFQPFEKWKAYVDAVLEEDQSASALRGWWNTDTRRQERQHYGERALPVHRAVLDRIKALEHKETADERSESAPIADADSGPTDAGADS